MTKRDEAVAACLRAVVRLDDPTPAWWHVDDERRVEAAVDAIISAAREAADDGHRWVTPSGGLEYCVRCERGRQDAGGACPGVVDRGGLTADTDGSRVLVADVESGGEDGPDVWLGVNGREVLNATTDESFARATLNPGWTLVRYIPAARLRELSVDLHDRMSTHARQSAALFRAGQERDAERAARERAEQPLAAVTAQRPGWMMTTCECPRPTVSAYCQVCGYGLPPDPRDAELSALRAEVAALRKVESAARAWGRSHTPAGWTDEEHAATPHVNLRTKWDDALADALRALDATDAKGGA